MSSFKIENNAGKSVLVIRGQKGQQINQREFYAVNTGQIPGLIRAEKEEKKNTFKLSYNISGYISLREFLFNPLNKQTFVTLLSNILDNLKNLQDSFFNQQYLVLDINAVWINPSSHSINFIFVPITFYDSRTNLKDFLLSIIQCCSFLSGEDTSYIRDYIQILNRGINFSIFDLEEYIKRLGVVNIDYDKNKKCSRCNSSVQKNDNFCPACGMKISNASIPPIQGVYDPLKESVPIPIAIPDSRYQSPAENFADVVYDNVDYSYEKATPQNYPVNNIASPQSVRPDAYLIKIRTGEQIYINSNDFSVGKDPVKNSYCITDNSAISRCHAVIKYRGDKWYLMDLNSTNKTYINETAIYSDVEVELYDGVSICFANEGFVFKIC